MTHEVQPLERLLDEVSAALAEMVEAVKNRGAADEIAQSLSDLVAVLEKRKATDFAEIVKALQQLRIQPAVTVQPAPPAPIHVLPAPVHVQFQPSQGDSTWEVRIAGHYGSPDRVMTISRKGSAP